MNPKSDAGKCPFHSAGGAQATHRAQSNAGTPGIIVPELMDFQMFGLPWLFYIMVMFTMAAGTMLLMWIGEQISEKGIGNGISLIIS